MLLLNNQPVKHFYFSGGEIQVKLPELIKEERVKLTWKPSNPDHIMLLLLTVDALKQSGIHDIDLDILYLPYARQDRVCSPGEAFSLKVMCKILDDLEVTTIRIWDIHNRDAVASLLNRNHAWIWEAYDIFARYKILNQFDLSDLVLCAPDKGAVGRVKKVVDHFNLQEPVFLDKERNPETGAIEGIYFNPLNRTVEGYNVMIIDDICDGGATFIEAAKCLKGQGAENLYLYVTHGIFSKGLDELSKHFSHVYCHHVLDDGKFAEDLRLTILKGFTHASEPALCN